MTQASGEKGWWGLMVLALVLTLLSGAAQATPDAAAWAFDLLARAEQQQPTGPLDFLPGVANDQPIPTAAQARIQAGYGRLPMHFEPNLGQTADEVKFVARGPGYTLFLTANEAVLALRQGQPRSDREHRRHPPLSPEPALAQTEEAPSPGAVVRMRLEGATRNTEPRLEGLQKLPGISNYFLGNDPAKWRTHVPHYRQVKYQGVYPGIDLVYYGNPQRLEHDFIVAPGADPAAIQLAISGAEQATVNAEGDLVLKVPGGEVVQQAPKIYQVIDGRQQAVAGRYVLRDAAPGASPTVSVAVAEPAPPSLLVGFEVAQYDRKQPLVIDPVLVYSTYLGGSNGEYGRGIAVDGAGNAYVTGRTYSYDFPIYNALDTKMNSYDDTFIVKLNPSGTALVYATYLGGSSSDYGTGITVDGTGNAYVTGYTGSSDFPTREALYASYKGSFDAYITKLNTDGTALIYSTYLGGSGKDYGYGIAVDRAGNAYVTGLTESSNFPTRNPLDPSYGSDFYSGDCFLAKFNNSGTVLIYSTYLGGSSGDVCFSITVDSSGNVYVTGKTNSTDFSIFNALYPNKGSNVDYAFDAFVTKLNNAGTALVYSTYLGGNGQSQGNSIASDGVGNAYVTGETNSTNFPTRNALYPNLSYWAYPDAFITKINPNGTALVYSTYLGGYSYGGYSGDRGYGIAVDGAGNVYVTGSATSGNFPIGNALYPNHSGQGDAFITKLNASGTTLVYSTYFGGSSGDQGFGIAVDVAGNAYVTGETDSANFPIRNALYPNYRGSDAFIVKISDEGGAPPTPRFVFAPITSPQADGQPFPVAISALNAQGNPLALSGPVQLSSPGVTINPTSVQFANGAWSGNLTVYGAGTGITLKAFAQGITGASDPFTVNGPGSQSASLSGQVTDLTARPLVNATVHLEAENGGGSYDTVTDSTGRYALGPVPAGAYTLWAEYGANPPRESKHSALQLSSYGPQTQDIEINAYPSGIPVLLVPGILGSNKKTHYGAIPHLPKYYPADASKLMLHGWDSVGWDALAQELEACGMHGYKVPYDWRAPVKDVAEKYLKPAIEQAKQETGSDKVYIVAHSTGGLAARYYIQNMQQQDSGGDIAKLAMVGTPHLGAANAYYIWSGGDPLRVDNLVSSGVWWGNFYWNSIEGLYENTYDLGDLRSDDVDTIYEFVHSAQAGSDRIGAELHDLLPTFKLLYYKNSGDWGLTSADNKNTTLLDLNADPNRDKRMTKDGAGGTVRSAVFYSSSEQTIRRHETINPDYFSLYLPRYADGGPAALTDPQWANGDGTVLDFSAKFPCNEGWANCIETSGKHSKLIGSAKTLIRNFLAADQTVCPAAATMRQAAAVVEADELAVSIQGRVRPYVTTPGGAASGVNPVTALLEEGIPDARIALDAQDGSIALVNPANGVYRLSISGAAQEEVLVTLSYLTEAQSYEEKVRLFHHGGTSTFSFGFDQTATEPLTIDHPPAPPVNARAEAVDNGGWITRIAWQASPTAGVSGYRVYGRRSDEPFLSLLGTTSGVAFDTSVPWAGQNGAPLSIFAVSAVLPDGHESFLTELIENNDRDHDGLSDSREAALGTNPGLPDTDGDSLTDSQEIRRGSDPLLADTDGDGVPDGRDVFPRDPTESVDTDGDGIGDNTDNCPARVNPDQADTDGDGIGDACENTGDVNGDGKVDALDVVAVINHFLGTQTWPQADVNGDGTVNALDVVVVINRVLGV